MDTIEKSGKKQADATEDYERQLIHRGIKPTAVRLLVVRALANAECALSLTSRASSERSPFSCNTTSSMTLKMARGRLNMPSVLNVVIVERMSMLG